MACQPGAFLQIKAGKANSFRCSGSRYSCAFSLEGRHPNGLLAASSVKGGDPN
jgi:hypothetical protein